MDSLISAHRPTPCCFHHSPSPPDSRPPTRNEVAMRPVHRPFSHLHVRCQWSHIRALDIEVEMRQKRQQVARKSAHSGHFGHATCWTASAVSASKARSNVKCGKNGKPSQRQRIRPPACAACTNPNSGHFGQHPRPVSFCAPRRKYPATSKNGHNRPFFRRVPTTPSFRVSRRATNDKCHAHTKSGHNRPITSASIYTLS